MRSTHNPQPIKVLHVAETIKGGIASLLNDVILLHAQNHPNLSTLALIPADQMSALADVPAHITVFHRTGRNLSSLLNLARAVREGVTAHAPDIVFLHSSIAGAVGRLALIGLTHRPLVIYCSHGWAFTRQAPTLVKHFWGILEGALSYIYTDAIVNISQSEHRSALTYGLPTTKMRVVYNGVRQHSPKGTNKKPRTGPIKILFVGRFDRQKGLDRLLNAYQVLDKRKFRLTLIGEPTLNNEDTPPIPPNIRSLGWKPRVQLTKEYQSADVLVVPSRWEGFGLVAAEAMEAGTAVLAADVGGLPEIVANGETGYLFTTDQQLVQILATATRSQLHSMGRAGRKRFLALFDVRRTAEQLYQLFHEVMSHRAKPTN